MANYVFSASYFPKTLSFFQGKINIEERCQDGKADHQIWHMDERGKVQKLNLKGNGNEYFKNPELIPSNIYKSEKGYLCSQRQLTKKENESSQNELEALKAEIEILKQKKEIDTLKGEINLINKRESFKEEVPNKEDYFSNYSGYKKKGKFKVFALCFITFGIYGLFLLYDWIKTVNKVRKRQVINPQNYILITIFTCTIGSIYYI